MTNTNRKTRFVNLLIATVAAVVIMLTCMVPHAVSYTHLTLPTIRLV